MGGYRTDVSGSVWSRTWGNDWCGEWKPRAKLVERWRSSPRWTKIGVVVSALSFVFFLWAAYYWR